LLKPAADRLRERLAAIEVVAPRIPVINNIDVTTESELARIRDALARQAAGPVRWADTIRKMAEHGITHVIECGPGRVLTGLTKRIAPEVQGWAISDEASLRDVLEKVKAAA
jgi:[acyl-carrier-protein] S-malonyltransferase